MTIATSRDPAGSGDTARPLTGAGYDRASWRESAACRNVDTELFFPIGKKSGIAVAEIEQAKAICGRCPVRQPCLAYALATRQEFGIWGGCDEDERRPLHSQWRAASSVIGRGQPG